VAGKQTQVAGVKGKHPTHRANKVNSLGGNCNEAHTVRIATLPPSDTSVALEGPLLS
jgi:hypothetical protein